MVSAKTQVVLLLSYFMAYHLNVSKYMEWAQTKYVKPQYERLEATTLYRTKLSQPSQSFNLDRILTPAPLNTNGSAEEHRSE